MIVTDIRDLFTIYGDFAEVEGAPTRCEDGYEFQNDIFFIKSSFFKHSSGVNKRSDTIKNISDHPVTIMTALSKFTINGGEYEVYTQYNEHISEGQGAWAPLVTGVYGQSDEIRTNQDVNPFVALYNTQNQRGLVFHLMAESMFEYRVCRDAEFLGPRLVRVEMGIKSDNFSYTLAPNEELRLPDTLFYTFKSKLDLDAYKLHRYSNELYKKPLPIIYNSWMSHFDLMSYDSLMEQLKRASAIGCEYFTVDAGWFGETQKWWDVVGDWVEPEDCGMCGRLSEFATQVREFGLKFGLWFEIERSSKFSRSICEHSEHYIIPSGQHAYINFASSEAVDYIYAKLKACIDKYGVELIKFDLNAPLRFDSTRHAFIDFYRGFIEFLSRIKREYPGIHLQCCASGGGRMSMSLVPYFDSFWASDNHGIYEQLDIFKSTLVRMPCSILEKWATIRSLEGFTPSYPVGNTEERILLSADCSWFRLEEANLEFIKNALCGGPIGVSCDLTQVSDATLGALGDFICAYKAERELWQDSECHILCNTPTLTILQFNDKSFDKIRIFAFTDKYHQDNTIVFPITDGKSAYSITKTERHGAMCLDNVVMTSSELDESGVELCAWGLRQSYRMTLDRIK